MNHSNGPFVYMVGQLCYLLNSYSLGRCVKFSELENSVSLDFGLIDELRYE